MVDLLMTNGIAVGFCAKHTHVFVMNGLAVDIYLKDDFGLLSMTHSGVSIDSAITVSVGRRIERWS